ncbi:MAG: LL-diaminopimelate aminotransferase [Bacteroides sp.]|nr:LL-diaminopimelate aminotransferase [Bacteroides sp.]MBO5466561.1 LL-diaminopimelate aminotransferase [Prevotella sp.]MBQ2950390.1 LL-diaminopimelate aminotransferase [Prevotella sp.]
MALVNEHFQKLSDKFLFAEIAKRMNACKVSHPKSCFIDLGAGDVSQPLCPAVVEAMHKAVDELGRGESFKGYGPEQGYKFLREAIVKHDYLPRGVHIDPSEIFISDGVKSDIGNIQELVRWDNSIAVPDPAYPVYIDSNAMIGRAGVMTGDTWSNVTYLKCTRETDFKPQLPSSPVDIIYLCYPNNPTGTVLTKDELRKWVNYAIRNDALIFFDAAYEAYIQDPAIPRSIYEIKGARQVAIEFRSYSKTAGFTGVRCGYTVVPKALTAVSVATRERISLNKLWLRRQTTKFNGASYVSQRAAEAIYSPEGQQQIASIIQYYMDNARMMSERLKAGGHKLTGGVHSPYLWVEIPKGYDSWDYFNHLLYNANVVCAPGVGFGPSGEGYVRLTALARREDCLQGVEQILRCR